MRSTYETYADFLRADARRREDALELGHDWLDRDGRYRVCWYAATGELTTERLTSDAHLDVGDFHAGVPGPVRVLAVIRTRDELEALVGRWPALGRARPRTIARLRELTRA